MKQPIHTPGPIKWSEDFGLYSDHGTITNACNGAQYDDSSDPATIEISKPDARLLVAGYNAFDSAAQHLGLNAVEFAERMADGALADLLESHNDMLYRFHSCISDGNGEIEGDKEAMARARAVIEKVKGINL